MRSIRRWFGNWVAGYTLRHAKRSHDKSLALCEARSGATVVDLGTGDGSFSIRMAERVGAGKVIGIDVMPENVTELRAKGIEVVMANLENGLPLADESVDVVSASHIIEHVSDTDLLVKECFCVLRGGGYMMLATPNLAALYNILFLLLGKQPPVTSVSDVVGAVGDWDQVMIAGGHRQSVSPRHRRVFTRSALVDLLRYYGFTVEKTTVSGFPPLPWWAADLACAMLPTYAWNILVRARKPA